MPCGGEEPLSVSVSLFLSLHPKRERTPEETTPRRFSYYFWESLGPIVLAIPRDSVPFFLPSWSEDPRWARGEKRGRRNRAEDGFGVIEMTRGSNAEFDETRRDEANRRRPFFPLDSRNGETRNATRLVFSFFFFLSFLLFSSDRKRQRGPYGRRGGRADKLSFVHHEGLGWANRAILVSSLHLFFARSNERTNELLSPSSILSPFRSFFRPLLPPPPLSSPSFSFSFSSSRSTPLHASFSLRSSCSPLSSPSPRVASPGDGSSAFEARKPKLNYQLDVARRHAFAR